MRDNRADEVLLKRTILTANESMCCSQLVKRVDRSMRGPLHRAARQAQTGGGFSQAGWKSQLAAEENCRTRKAHFQLIACVTSLTYGTRAQSVSVTHSRHTTLIPAQHTGHFSLRLVTHTFHHLSFVPSVFSSSLSTISSRSIGDLHSSPLLSDSTLFWIHAHIRKAICQSSISFPLMSKSLS